jgi:hypothetical protein
MMGKEIGQCSSSDVARIRLCLDDSYFIFSLLIQYPTPMNLVVFQIDESKIVSILHVDSTPTHCSPLHHTSSSP